MLNKYEVEFLKHKKKARLFMFSSKQTESKYIKWFSFLAMQRQGKNKNQETKSQGIFIAVTSNVTWKISRLFFPFILWQSLGVYPFYKIL